MNMQRSQTILAAVTLDLESDSRDLAGRVDDCQYSLSALPELPDKWILSSALQKMVRRGQSEEAVAVALRLHQVDPAYLPRRLPIIALEDIGLGDLAVCHDVLTACSSSRWWRAEVDRTIAFLVGSMAKAIKCRAACDADCLAESHRDTPAMMPLLLEAGTSKLIEIASDRGRPRLQRINALRVLGGISVRQGIRYTTVSRCDLPAVDRVAEELKLPPLMRAVIARGRKASSLAAMLPIAAEAAVDRVIRIGVDFPHSLDSHGGIPLCGIDMFSECGRGALREFFLSSPAFRAFADKHIHATSPMRLFNMALFHTESSILGRYLSSPALDRLTREVELEEMRHLGMTDPGNSDELRDLIRADADRLAAIRTKRLTAFMRRDAMQGDGGREANHV